MFIRQFVKGKYDENVESANSTDRQWSESDMQNAVRDLVNSAAAHPAISNSKRPPIVMVTVCKTKPASMWTHKASPTCSLSI